MSRTWPFEDEPDPQPKIRTPAQFVAARGEGVDAVVVRIGLNDAQLVLVDARGDWQRWVYHSMEEAQGAARELEIPVHVDEYPEDLRVRINSYRRPASEYDRAPYPEQGRVGPVIPYPENRPRRLDAPTEEVADQARPATDR